MSYSPRVRDLAAGPQLDSEASRQHSIATRDHETYPRTFFGPGTAHASCTEISDVRRHRGSGPRIQVCGGSRYDTSFFRGLMLWDVTDPASPQLLGSLNTCCCTRGLHEFEIQQRPDLGRTVAYVSVPASEYPDDASPSGVRDEAGHGDFRLIDITDPRMPFEVSDWGVVKDTGGPLGPGLGCDPDPIFGHSAEPSNDGRQVFVSYWDSGFVALDVTNPADPTLLGHTVYPANADGDGHSASYDDARALLFTADEDFCKTSGPATETGFGYMRVYAYSNPAAPVQIGEYRTPNSLGTNDQAAGDYVIHNPLVVGTDVLLSWYSDGIRVVDASDPRQPREVAHFVPPAAANPDSAPDTSRELGVECVHHGDPASRLARKEVEKAGGGL